MKHMPSGSNDAARGALWGLAVGDALGTTYEFKRMSQPSYPELAVGPATDVVGGGPFSVPRGAITDDTQLAVCLARSIADNNGTINVEDIARRYVAWIDGAFDVGGQTSASIGHLQRGSSPRESGLNVWRGRGSGSRAAGNGSLMRTAPIGVAIRGFENVVRGSIDDSLITHASPLCMLACAAFNAAIACAVEGNQTPAAMLAAAVCGLDFGVEYLKTLMPEWVEIETARVEIASDIAAAHDETPGVHGSPVDMYLTQGFVRVALRLAMWHLVHATSYETALVDVASRGGDSDTNGAIVGALLGARFGEKAIPVSWRKRVSGAKQRGSREWGEDHHPGHFERLA